MTQHRNYVVHCGDVQIYTTHINTYYRGRTCLPTAIMMHRDELHIVLPDRYRCYTCDARTEHMHRTGFGTVTCVRCHASRYKPDPECEVTDAYLNRTTFTTTITLTEFVLRSRVEVASTRSDSLCGCCKVTYAVSGNCCTECVMFSHQLVITRYCLMIRFRQHDIPDDVLRLVCAFMYW